MLVPANRNIARERLDARFDGLRALREEPRPHRGWIRAIRDALGMSGRELAERAGVSQRAIAEVERSERQDTIKLETLRRTADALDCELVYYLLPRTNLNEAVTKQARKKAAQALEPLAHHSRLEDQAVTADDAARQLEELAARLIDRRGLWSDANQPR